MARIVIIGGHGKVALLLAKLLADRGDSVISLIRNPDQAAQVSQTGAEPVVLDIETATEADISDAILGYDAVVFAAGAGGGNPERTIAVDQDAAVATVVAASNAGVKRLIMVSYLGAGPDHGVPPTDSFYTYAQAKAAADAAVRASSLDWTILMPGHLTLDEPTGEVDPTAVRSATNVGTSRGNVALVAAAALRRPDTIGKDLPFTDGSVPIALAWRD